MPAMFYVLVFLAVILAVEGVNAFRFGAGVVLAR